MVNFWTKLPKPFSVLAPMDEVTDIVFRRVLSKASRPDVFFTEFTSIDGLLSKGKDKVIQKLKFEEDQHPIVAQIWGSNPENFYKAVKYISSMGFDGIDINMGCPDRTVRKNNGGSALINQKELVQNIVSAIRSASSEIPLSIKTRLDTTPELTKNWHEFLLNLDLQAITLHARTAKAMSKGEANWQAIGDLVKLKNQINPNTIIIGNGNVKSWEESVSKHVEFGVDGVMIGRGVFHNPWVFQKDVALSKQHSVIENLKLLKFHMEEFHTTWGSLKNFEIMKKFVKVYVKGYPGADELRKDLMNTKNFDDAVKVLVSSIEQLKQNKIIL